ncbi:MAG: prolipoprotein diacylglyceryl transferase family protein [Planctomycetota bacterium]
MLDEVFRLPHEIMGVPFFGIGWVLLLWGLIAAVLLTVMIRRHGWSPEVTSLLPMLVIGALAIVFLMPRLEQPAHGDVAMGMPLRGYGLMVTLGVIAGGLLAARQARENGVDPEEVFGLAFYCFVGGIIGARTFYVVQYREEYFHGAWTEWLPRVLNFTEGGLVVYGSLLGALPACYYYVRKHRLPIAAMADLVAPSFMVGLAIGRIGCYLHGCCFAGLCPHDSLTVHFPIDSPPYQHQLARGQLHGFTLKVDESAGRVVIYEVEPGGAADRAGLRAGDVVEQINGRPVPPLATTLFFTPVLLVQTDRLPGVTVELDELPARSGPTVPVQIFSSLHAAALGLLLWTWFPFRRRDGEVFTLLLTLYPLGRVLEEIIRDDEPGRLQTNLTISQWVSLVVFLVAMALWILLLRRPHGTIWPKTS